MSSPSRILQVELKPKPAGMLRVRKCLYVLAGFLLYPNTSGILNAFGVYQAYYQSVILSSYSTSAISWIGSTQVFIGMAFGLFTGPLYDRGYLRPLVISGSCLTVSGLMMSRIARSYYQIFLAQGVCVGLGMGFTYVPMLAAVSMYFASKRPVALGICSTGAVVGGTLVPIVTRGLNPRVGFGEAVRFVGVVNLGCAEIALGIWHPYNSSDISNLAPNLVTIPRRARYSNGYGLVCRCGRIFSGGSHCRPFGKRANRYYMLAQAVPGAITILGAIFLLCPLMAMNRSDQREKSKTPVSANKITAEPGTVEELVP